MRAAGQVLRFVAIFGSARAQYCNRSLANGSLVAVLLVHRHGDRTPITPMADRDFWASKIPRPTVINALGAGSRVLRSDAQRKAGTHVAAGDGVFGTLTERGLDQMRSVGSVLRRRLLDLGFGHTLARRSVRVWSTDFPRTVQSTQAMLSELLDDENEDETVLEIDVTHSDMMIPDPNPRHTAEQATFQLFQADF